jgi:hypothetical protein
MNEENNKEPGHKIPDQVRDDNLSAQDDKTGIGNDKKKPLYKRWWFWLIIVVLALVFVGYGKDYYDNHKGEKLKDYAKDLAADYTGKPVSDNLEERKEQYGIIADFTPESKAGFNYNGPTIVNDFMYIGTSTRIGLEQSAQDAIDKIPTNYFYKLSLDLKPVWSYEMGKTMTSGGAVLDSKGNIYFATEDFSVDTGPESKDNKMGLTTELNLVSLTSDGQFRWKKLISRPGGEPWHHATIYPAIGTDDTIYVSDSKFFAFDTEGNQQWQYPTDSKLINGLRTAPIIDKSGHIYFVSPEPTAGGISTDQIRAYKFNAEGKLIWSTLLDNQIVDPEGPYKGNPPNGGGHKENLIYSSPAFSVGEKYIYAPVGSTINKVDIVTGKIAWSLKPEGATGTFKSNPSVDGQDNIYLGTKSNDESTLFAISAEGKIVWKKLIGGDLYPTPILGDDGLLYVQSEQGKDDEEAIIFRTVDIKTGVSSNKLDDKGALPGGGFSASVIYQGYMYSTAGETYDDKGNIKNVGIAKRKVSAQGYPADSPWPKGHGRNDNSGHSNN